MTNPMRFAALAALLASSAASAQQACNTVTVLEDPEGDYSGYVSSTAGMPVPAGLLEHDITSVVISQLPGNLVQIVLKVGPFESPALLPNATWFVSFDTPEGGLRGVHLVTDDTGAETMSSYRVAPGGLQDDGPSDGRFAEEGEIPTESGSNWNPDGTITWIVKAENIGIEGSLAGQSLGPFNAATLQGVNGVVVSGAFDLDTAPDTLARDGFYDFTGCAKSTAAVKSAATFATGALPAASLLALALAGLARRRRR